MAKKDNFSILFLSGDFTYNRGDRGNMASAVKLLKKRFPKAQISALSYNPEKDEKWIPVKMIPTGLKGTMKQLIAIAKADIIIWGGGGPIQDNASWVKPPYWVLKLFLVRLLGCRIMAWAQGVGPIERKVSMKLAKIAFRMTDVITVRNDFSIRNLKRIGVTKIPYFKTADPAFCLQPSNPEVGRGILNRIKKGKNKICIGVAVCFCSFHYRKNDIIPYTIAKPLGLRNNRVSEREIYFIKNMSKFLDKLINKFNVDIVLLPTYLAPWEKDIEKTKEIISLMKNKDNVSFLDKDNTSPEDYLSLIGQFDYFIGTPMHSTIFSTCMNVPTINIAYEPKCIDYFRDMLEMEEYLYDINRLIKDDWKELLNIFEKLMKNKLEIKDKLIKKTDAFKKKVLENVDILETTFFGENYKK